MPVDGKKKGGEYERKVAKQLSTWMFNDPNTLKRHPSSGADKCIWTGDIVPMKQLPDEWNKHFPFIIECKTGYEDYSPTFWSYNQIEKWYIKAFEEGKLTNQFIVFLICQFLNKSAILITNSKQFENYILPKCIIPIQDKQKNIHWCNVYLFRNILELSFNNIFNIGD